MTGCGPVGGSSAAPTAYVTPGATPLPLPSLAPFSVATTVAVPASAGSTSVQAQNAGGGFSSQVTFPVANVPAGTQLTQTITNVAPSGVTPFALARGIQPQAVRRALDASNVTVLYACYTFSTNVTLTSGPSLSFALPAGFTPTGVTYYLAIFLGGAWEGGYDGAGSLSGGTVAFSGGFPFTFTAQNQTCFALYAQSSSSAPPTQPPAPASTPSSSPSTSPSQSPSASPTASPSSAPTSTPTSGPTATPSPAPTPTPTAAPGALTLSISSVAFFAPGQSQQFTATQAGCTAFGASSDDSVVASVAATQSPNGFTITAGPSSGTATITVTGCSGQSAPVAASLTIVQGVIKSVTR